MFPADTWKIQNEVHEQLVSAYIPPASEYKYDRCNLYQDEAPNDIVVNTTDLSNASLHSCTQWVYSRDVFKETFTSEQNFVCGDSLKTSHIQLVFYFGVLCGDLGFGLLADIIGRKKSFLISAVFQLASALGVVWAPNFLVYTILQFCVGAGCHGVFICSCVLGLELVGPNKRVWAGILIHGFFTTGLIYLSGAAWIFKHWQFIQLAAAIPCAFYLSYWWLLDESPRWLISVGRTAEAEKIIQKMAKQNNTQVPEKLFDGNTTATTQAGGKLWELFTNKVLFLRTMILFFNWVVVSMCYYGVTMYAGTIGGNFYLNFFLLAVAEIPKFVNIPMLERLGRRWTHICFMWLGGFALIGMVFTVVYGGQELHWATLTLSLIGKLGPAGAFSTVYVFSLELYPTVLRNAGMGASSCVARFGGMAAPYVAKMGELIGGDFGKALPLVIFGASSILAGFLCIFLPETLHQQLPDTAEEAAKFKGRMADKRKTDKIVFVGNKENNTMDAGTEKCDLGDESCGYKNGIVNYGYENTKL
ncbi:organic cation transporter protein-like isoform X2 [Mya arenaria]|nr:organic cation transporter protein-like isoform X2 [Mya arenaria]